MSRVSGRFFAVAVLASVIATPASAQKLSKLQQQFLALTPADFTRTMAVKDDALDTVARFSTEGGFQEKRGLLKIAWYDNFLRAFIDKKTGETSFQLYQFITYDGDWRFYQTANFETPAGPDSKPVTVISRDVLSCSAYGGCTFSEHLGLDLPEPLLRQLAASYTPGVPHVWNFKFGGKAGVDFQDAMNVAEIVAMLDAVDRYRASHRFAAPSPNSPLKSAEAVAATESTPPIDAKPSPSPAKPPLKAKPAKRPGITCITCN